MDANNRDVNHSLFTAVRYGNLKLTRKLITSFGLSYSQAWSEGYVLLCLAVENKHSAIAKLLLTSGAKVNSQNTEPINTPLHFACKNGDLEIVKMLLDKRADVIVENQFGRTPLHSAIEKVTKILYGRRDNDCTSLLRVAVDIKCSQIVEHLLKSGADVNCICTGTLKKGYTPLHFAVEARSEEVVELLLSRGANVEVKGENGITPLHIAAKFASKDTAEELFIHVCSKKRSKIINLLLQHGANVDDQDTNDQTTLHLAVKEGCLTIVKDVLRYHPDINNQSNRSSFEIAVCGHGEEYKKIVEALLEYGFSVDPKDANNLYLFLGAVMKGCLKIVQDLLKHGADVNAIHEDFTSFDGSYSSAHPQGVTPLHIAARYKQEEVAKLLISCGADINAQDKSGNAPIFYAVESADLKIFNLLLTHGASVKHWPALLNKAVEKGCIEIVEAILQHDADINASDEDGRTALHFTALSDYEDGVFNIKGDIAELLLSRGARVDAKNRNGETTLHAAAKKGCVKVVEALLKYNANVNSRGKTSGITPLHLSTHGGNEEICVMLLNKGAHVNATQNDGTTALQIAIERGHEEVTVTLLDYGSDINMACGDGRTPHDAMFRVWCNNRNNNFDLRVFSRVLIALKRQIVKMKTANLHVSEQNLQSISRICEISGFQGECEKEIAWMKHEKINCQNISFYDILAKGTSSLAILMRNENIVRAFKSGLYKFPIYARMIDCHLRKAMERNDLLEQGNKMFHFLSNNFPKLPYECTEKIFSYLSNENLNNLMDACTTSHQYS